MPSREAADRRRAERLTDWIARGCPPSPPALPKAKKEQCSHIRPIMLRILEIQRGVCVGCGRAISASDTSANMRLSVDHVYPRSRGGVNAGNRLAMHRLCNAQKGSRPPTGCELVWLAAVNARMVDGG
jgi:5-methylcytosine-specific restriction endonuclease McrA